MSSNDLYGEMRRRGSHVTKGTVMSTLSRKKDVFEKDDAGIWKKKSTAVIYRKLPEPEISK